MALEFSRIDTIKDNYFLLMCGTIKGVSERVHVVNVYAPQSASAKRVLWEQLKDLKVSREGVWIFLGDFNQVRSAEERRNCIFDPTQVNDFNSFIYKANLSEYIMNGFKFTRWLDGDNKLSKLDRMLVCDKFWGLWPTATLRALPKNLSDHCPLLLSTTSSNYGHIIFKLFNAWLHKPGLDNVVRSSVSSFTFVGAPDIALAGKLRCIKKAIKEWNKTTKQVEDANVTTSIAALERLDLLSETHDLSDAEATA
ncbi:uncharacterized protein LOC143611877 [Bidens hawaiensis]|uniref:uncharacterized protein LOC143611877 n=1 Tax=Bidens hawaiensis TaxID=980011 RepID=UPI0040490555